MQGQVKIIGNYSYNLKHCLGEGAYGKVYQGTDTTNNGKVAIKKLDLKNFERDTYLRNQIISEIEILKKFNHKNIVKFIDLISTQRSLYIITEFCKDGDLREIMARKKYTEQEAWKILKQIVAGFKELVTNGIIHRDLKPANILSHEGVFKIADFGFAKYVDNFSSQLLRSCVGSPLYMAPQILARKPYSTKCDIWSLGIIYFEMVFQDVPWKGRDERDLLKNILSVPLNWKKGGQQSINKQSEDFLRKSLTIEETERVSWEKVFEIFELGPLGSISNNVASMENIKANYSSQTQSQKEQRKKSIFNQNVPQPVASPSNAVNLLKQQHHEIAFRNFVLCCDLFPKYTTMKNVCSQMILEKLMICLSKTNLSMQLALLVQANTNIQQTLKKELDYYSQFHNELIEQLQRNGQLSHCERDLECLTLRETQTSDADIDRFQGLMGQWIKQICNEVMDDCKKTHSLSRSTLITLDNLADVVLIHRKVQKSQEIDYDQLNSEKAEEEDIKRLIDKINDKTRSI